MLWLVGSLALYETEVVYAWKPLNFGGIDFNVSNVVITGLKVFNGQVFVTSPRWRPGTPYTLLRVGSNNVLEPWPSAAWQDQENCSALQNVQSMEITPDGVMWVLDSGRGGAAVDACHPRLVWFDIATGGLIDTYTFDTTVAPYASAFLNDIVVDVVDDVAYISDSGSQALIVFDRKRRAARRFSSSETTSGMVDGIGLTGDGETVLFCPLRGTSLYSVDAGVLKNFSSTTDEIHQTVRNLGAKPGPSDGLAVTESGVLYFGDIEHDALYSASAPLEGVGNARLVAQGAAQSWVDTFAFDDEGWLWYTANSLQLPPVDVTFQVVRTWVCERSYMRGRDAPKGQYNGPPCTAGDDGKAPKKKGVLILAIAVAAGVVVVAAIVVGVVFCVLKYRQGQKEADLDRAGMLPGV